MSVVPDRSSQKGSDKDDSCSNLSYLKNDDNKQDGDQQDNTKKTAERDRLKPTAKKPLQTVINATTVAKKDKAPELTQVSTEGIFLYKPGVELPNLFPFIGQQIKIIIASEYISKSNPQFIKRNIFGSEAYTSNSDAFCIAVHSEKINVNSFNHRKYEGIQLTCKITRPKRTYTGTLKNGISSRSIKGYDGNALKPQLVRNLTSLGPLELLEKYAGNMHIPIGTKRIKAKPRNISTVIPIPETHIVFNMNNEPAYKYSLFNIADRGFQKSQWVIKRLDTNVLYLQGEDVKYELYKKSQREFFDVFRFSIVRNPQRIDNEFMVRNPPPLSQDMIEVIYSDLEWQEILWGNNSIQVKDKNFTGLRSFKYYKMDPKQRN